MKDAILKLFFLSFSLLYVHMAEAQVIQNGLKLKNDSLTYWYTGVIQHGYLLPVNDGYEADLYGNNYGNQIQPLLLSNQGDVIWSEDPIKINISPDEVAVGNYGEGEIKFTKAGETLKEAYQLASQVHFECSGELPDEMLFSRPQYNTWIELMYDQNQKDILSYAHKIIENDFPPGVFMIDDNWQEDYGKWNFHPGRFPDPGKMIDELHDMGFKVMVWVCPFVSPDCDVFRDLERKGLLLKDESGGTKIIRWWNGYSGLIDLSNPGGVEWFKSQLDLLIEEYGVDGFKLDAGDPEYYVGAVAYEEISPNAHSELFARIGLAYPLNESRANWKMGGQAIANRLRDKAHKWEDLRTLVPNMITAGLMGYAYSCPDMIGGGEFTSFLEGAIIDQELIVRSAQCHALMPMMQFSVAPWRILDSIHFQAVKEAVRLRENIWLTSCGWYTTPKRLASPSCVQWNMSILIPGMKRFQINFLSVKNCWWLL